jgi:hypothetical protein
MDTQADICPLCGRALGRRRERHHLVPRLKGGRETVTLHPICHRKIHTVFSEAELARAYASVEALRAHPEVARFAAWLDGKPADFHASTRKSRENRR